ncbi:MAG: hypothetical protein HFF81_05115 [Oscillospiraceae bacterium]|nr:hypothetical protein [Oscillospiraceae bacterium]
MSSEKVWHCIRQRAGPLVKECRSIRPRIASSDTVYERTEKNKILRPPRDSSVCRTRVDRLELRLALFGDEGSVYALTFDREHEPSSFQDVRRAWRSFLYRLKKWRNRPFDYVYLIEGRHGDRRYHIHLVLRDSDFSPAEVRYLWKFGVDVDDQPLLRHPRDTYRRTAKYFNKEATDGITIPISSRTWVCSRSLIRKLPPAECWRDTSGDIPIPPDARCHGTYNVSNAFGEYRYAWCLAGRPAPPDGAFVNDFNM